MSASTGPVIAAGLITIGNRVVIQGHPTDNHVIQTAVGTAIVAGTLALVENILPGTATAAAWLILFAVILVRVDPTVPAPAEALATWYQAGSASKRTGSGTF